MRVALVASLLVAGVALAGTYGGVTRNYAGYSASVDCSVGHWRDHAAEAHAFEQCKQTAAKTLDEHEAELARIYRHFTTGAHARRAFVGKLARAAREGDWEHSVSVELRFPAPPDHVQPIAARPITIALFTTDVATAGLRTRLAFDFAASQLAPGGALAAAPVTTRDPSETQQLLTSIGDQLRSSPYVAWWMIAERRDDVAAIAKLTAPLPNKYAWQGDQRAALVNARVLDAYLHGRAIPDDAWTMAAKLDDASNCAAVIALVQPQAIDRAASLPKVNADFLRAMITP